MEKGEETKRSGTGRKRSLLNGRDRETEQRRDEVREKEGQVWLDCEQRRIQFC